MKKTLQEHLALIREKHALENADRPPPKVSGSVNCIDPRPFIDGWHNRDSD